MTPRVRAHRRDVGPRAQRAERVARQIEIEHGPELLRQRERGLQPAIRGRSLDAQEMRAGSEQDALVQQRQRERAEADREHRARHGRRNVAERQRRVAVTAAVERERGDHGGRSEQRHAHHATREPA